LTLQGHHQAFIVNQLMFRKLRTILGFQTMFTIGKCGRLCPATTYGKNLCVKTRCLNSIKYRVESFFVTPDYTYLCCGMQYVMILIIMKEAHFEIFCIRKNISRILSNLCFILQVFLPLLQFSKTRYGCRKWGFPRIEAS
jgi:hypothetical protein